MSKTLLAVLAHPDDETFGMGGTLALCTRQGVDVYLVCATRGEMGEMDHRYMRGFETAAQRREAELRCGLLRWLGTHHTTWMGWNPSSLKNFSPSSGVFLALTKPICALTRHRLQRSRWSEICLWGFTDQYSDAAFQRVLWNFLVPRYVWKK